VVRFATLLTSHPGAVEQRDLDELGAQLSTEKVFELVVAIATANLDQPIQRRARTPLGRPKPQAAIQGSLRSPPPEALVLSHAS
jgi:hypothetical protein